MTHVDIMMIIAIQCDSLCTNCRFLKIGLVDHIGVLQTPIIFYNYEPEEQNGTETENRKLGHVHSKFHFIEGKMCVERFIT